MSRELQEAAVSVNSELVLFSSLELILFSIFNMADEQCKISFLPPQLHEKHLAPPSAVDILDHLQIADLHS